MMPDNIQQLADDIVGSIAHAKGPETEALAWRRSGVERCLKCLAEPNSGFSDRGVLLRELVRLAGGFAVVAGASVGITSSDLPGLKRFGLNASEPSEGTFNLSLQDNRVFREILPASLRAITSLDPVSRRLQDEVLGDAALKRTAGYEHYTTATQKAAVRALLTMPAGATMIVTMPTGTGKSLLFQMGTRWWRETADQERPIVIVIVPTVALALDHERSVRAITGLESCRALTGNVGRTQREEVLQSFVRGEVPILFVSPELALNNWDELMIAARPLQDKPSAAKGRLYAVFIDEAHIIESWGRTFRPDFQRLSGLVAALRLVNSSLRCVLLSATIDDGAREVLRKSYSNDGAFLEIDSQVPRYEFDIAVHHSTSAENRDELVLSALDFMPRPCIVYTTLIKTANSLYERLRQRGFSRVELFTGEVSDPEERARVVNRWANDEIDLIVATSAFGMGVDKANVRAVIHCCMPELPSRYYQEIGRAARDGHQAMAACFWWSKRGWHTSSERDDLQTARSLATGDWLTLQLAVPRWKAMLDAARRLRRFDRDPKTGEPIVRIPLDAARPGLGPETGKPNRQWNMALLNLLQRAHAIQVLAVNEDVKREPSWTIRIAESQLLQEGREGEQYFQQLFDLREREQQSAKEVVSGFEKLLDGRADECLLAGVFELIETGRPVVAECGRCDWCRARNVSPPTGVRFGGTGSVWQESVRGTFCRLVPGLTIVHPVDPHYEKGLATLMSRLVEVGVEQFVVPDGLGNRCVQFLSTSHARLGFVLEIGEFFRQEWAFAELPGAILLPGGAHTEIRKQLLQVAKLWVENAHHRQLVVVAAAGEQVDGRPLSQIASKLAPYHEDALEKLGALQ